MTEDEIDRVADLRTAPKILVENYSCGIFGIFPVKTVVAAAPFNKDLRARLAKAVDALLYVADGEQIISV